MAPVGDLRADRRTRESPRRLRRSLLSRLGRVLFLTVFGLLLLSVAVVVAYGTLPPPATPLMVLRAIDGQPWHRRWVPYAAITPDLARAVVAAEDAKFCDHAGFDFAALEQAWEENQEGGRVRGGSTISMQTAKNVFLWPDRDWLRKGLEAYFTLLIELAWGKQRIIEVYLNSVEWGPGIYGAEAAANIHFGKSASALTRREAALLAAVLPNPLLWSAARPTGYIRGRASTIQARMNDITPDGLGRCL
jgi:monofunctional biosynthetic peptidoglycan transglycosylase